MKQQFLFAVALIMLPTSGLAQSSVGGLDDQLGPDTHPQLITSIGLRNIRKNVQEGESFQQITANSADVERHIELGKKTLGFLEGDLPRALDHYEALLRGEKGLLQSDKGRFLAQNGEFAETMLRWFVETRLSLTGNVDPNGIDLDKIDLGLHERNMRIEILQQATEKLEERNAETFDPKKTPSALHIMNGATWASKAFDFVDSRIALLEGYLASVPEDIDVSQLPTLEDEIKGMFARRIATFEYRLNTVEREAAKRRSQLVSEATADMRETELQDYLKEMEELFEAQREFDQMKAEKEKQEVVIESSRLAEQIETKYKRELAAAAERAESLQKELKQKDLDIDKITGEIEFLKDQLILAKKRRELPAEEKALISILTSKGVWKPSYSAGYDGCFDGNAKYDGANQVPHSLTALGAAGALDSDSQGLYKLYLILAAECDLDRPRFQEVFLIRNGHSPYRNKQPYARFMKTEEIDREFTKSSEARASMEKLKKIQSILSEYGDVLVSEGLLQE